MASKTNSDQIEKKGNSAPKDLSKRKKQRSKIVEPSTRVLRCRKPAQTGESLVTKTEHSEMNDKDASKKRKMVKKITKVEDNEGEPENKRIKSKEEIEKVVNSSDVGNSKSIYEFTATDINGKEVSLEKYKGFTCIIVNVASRCGHTASNYKELVELYNNYREDKGLRILAFPCNQFGKQEPQDNKKICEFAKNKNVEFDMFAKIEVNGKNVHPLWKFLKSQKKGPKGENIEWNFTKFLINKDGKVVNRFKHTIKPLALLNDLEKIW